MEWLLEMGNIFGALRPVLHQDAIVNLEVTILALQRVEISGDREETEQVSVSVSIAQSFDQKSFPGCIFVCSFRILTLPQRLRRFRRHFTRIISMYKIELGNIFYNFCIYNFFS